MSNLQFNYALGERHMGTLLDAYERMYGIHYFRPETHAPQHLFVPTGVKKGTLVWRQWMARAAGSDYRTQSMQHYARHARLYETYPRIYTKDLAGYMPDILAHILQTEGFGKWKAMTRYLPVLADTLAWQFGDDPLNIYRGGSIDSVLKLKKALKKEYGYECIPMFGPKISSLYAHFMEEKGLLTIEDALPVDIWVQQIFCATGIITYSGFIRADTLENEIRLFLCDLCAKRGWSRITLAHALWFLGNRGCKECYRHAFMEHSCVLWQHCRGRAASDDYSGSGLWRADSLPYRKGGSRTFKLEPIPEGSPQQPLFTDEC